MFKMPDKFYQRFLSVIIISIFLGAIATPFIVSNITKMCHAIQTTTPANIIPQPLYGFFHFDSPKEEYKKVTYAWDFGPVYVTGKGFNNFNYTDIYTGQFDGSEGPILYPPILHYLYNKTFCKFPFAQAALLHLSFQIVVLLGATYFVLRHYRLSIMVIPVTIVYFIILFLTPVGLSWFERGQFDIYPALAILFYMFAVDTSQGSMFAMSAFFASLKGTVFPFFIPAFIMYLLFKPSFKKLKFFLIFTSVILAAMLFFPYCWKSCLLANYQYQNSYIGGITLVNKIPRWALYIIPLMSALIYLIPLFLNKRTSSFPRTYLPYMTGVGALSILLASLSYEFRAICLIGFLPMVIRWAIKYKQDQPYQIGCIVLFVLFLFTVFHGYWIIDKMDLDEGTIINIYLLYFVSITTASVFNIFSKKGCL